MAKAKKAKPNPLNKKLYDDGMKMRKAVLGSATSTTRMGPTIS
jgi:hypothetical protein